MISGNSRLEPLSVVAVSLKKKLTESGEEIPMLNSQGAELGSFTASGPDPVGDFQLKRQVPHPIRFFLYKNIGVLPEAPGQDASSGAGGTDHEDWFAGSHAGGQPPPIGSLIR